MDEYSSAQKPPMLTGVVSNNDFTNDDHKTFESFDTSFENLASRTAPVKASLAPKETELVSMKTKQEDTLENSWDMGTLFPPQTMRMRRRSDGTHQGINNKHNLGFLSNYSAPPDDHYNPMILTPKDIVVDKNDEVVTSALLTTNMQSAPVQIARHKTSPKFHTKFVKSKKYFTYATRNVYFTIAIVLALVVIIVIAFQIIKQSKSDNTYTPSPTKFDDHDDSGPFHVLIPGEGSLHGISVVYPDKNDLGLMEVIQAVPKFNDWQNNYLATKNKTRKKFSYSQFVDYVRIIDNDHALAYVSYFDADQMRPVITLHQFSQHVENTGNYCPRREKSGIRIKSLEHLYGNMPIYAKPNKTSTGCIQLNARAPQDGTGRCNLGHLSRHGDICFYSADTFINWVSQSTELNSLWNAIERGITDPSAKKEINGNHVVDFEGTRKLLWIATGSAVSNSDNSKSYMNCVVDNDNSKVSCIVNPVEVVWKLVCREDMGVYVAWHRNDEPRFHWGTPNQFFGWLDNNTMTVYQPWDKHLHWFSRLGLHKMLVDQLSDGRHCFQTAYNMSDQEMTEIWSKTSMVKAAKKRLKANKSTQKKQKGIKFNNRSKKK